MGNGGQATGAGPGGPFGPAARFDDRLHQAVAQAERTGETVVLHVLDLGLADLNPDTEAREDGRGRGAARRLAELVRRCDAAHDLGGGRFAVLQRAAAGFEGALLLAHKLLEHVAPPTAGEGSPPAATVGLCFHAPGDRPEVLLARAEQATREARREGDRIRCWGDPAPDAVLRYDRLKQALARRELFLHFEPQVSLENGRILAFEGLLRWRHPRFGVLGPDAFVPLAEKSGLIFELGEWVLAEACLRCRDWNAGALHGVPVAVNVSATQLACPAFLEFISRTLERTRLPAGLLELELTETVSFSGSEPAAAALGRLKERGVRLALDDFGTGYSSLSYLGVLPADKVKIPKEFVHRPSAADGGSPAVEAIAIIGRRMGLEIVAEGVETFEQQRCVRAAGCHAAQGFLYAPPPTWSRPAAAL